MAIAMNLVRRTFKGFYIHFACLIWETKTLFKSLIRRTAAKFKTIKNWHLRICIAMNKCKTTISEAYENSNCYSVQVSVH